MAKGRKSKPSRSRSSRRPPMQGSTAPPLLPLPGRIIGGPSGPPPPGVRPRGPRLVTRPDGTVGPPGPLGTPGQNDYMPFFTIPGAPPIPDTGTGGGYGTRPFPSDGVQPNLHDFNLPGSYPPDWQGQTAGTASWPKKTKKRGGRSGLAIRKRSNKKR